MSAAHRKTDIGSGHDCHFPPSTATGGSPDVFVNGQPAGRMGDAVDCGGCWVRRRVHRWVERTAMTDEAHR